MGMVNTPNQARADALAQLKEALEIIRQGKVELAATKEKIAQAQRLVDESANILRDTWDTEKGPSPTSRPARNPEPEPEIGTGAGAFDEPDPPVP
jgi:hypothetical protein